MLPQSARCEFNPHMVHDNFSAPLWVIRVFINQSIKIKTTNMYVAMVCMWYVYYFVWRKFENMSLCSGSRVNTNYERIASWGGCQYWTGNPSILETPLAAHCSSQHLNHSTMTHPSKMYWHQLSTGSITHWLQHLALAYRYYFVWRKHENMSPCTGSRANTNYERIASWSGCQCWTGDLRDTPRRPHVICVCMYGWMDVCMQVYIQINQMR